MSKPANTHFCPPHILNPEPPHNPAFGLVDPVPFRKWLNVQIVIYTQAAAANPDKAGRPDEYFQGKAYAFLQVLKYLDNPTDPPGCDGDAYHENPNNPEVNYGDGKAENIKGLKL